MPARSKALPNWLKLMVNGETALPTLLLTEAGEIENLVEPSFRRRSHWMPCW